MLNNLPEDIIKYLVDELPPFTGVLIIRTDEDGKVIDFHGPHAEYLREIPKSGKAIHEYLPALYSMIPPLISPMILNKIQSNSNVYSDIHIVESNENDYWVFIVDQSHKVEGIRDIIQKMNEEKFSKERKQVKRLIENASPYEVFGDLILEIISDEEAIIQSNVPEWFRLLAPGILINSTINFTDIFPFLEVFLFEANEFWSNEKNGKYKSGIWTENLPDNGEISLNSIAIFNNDTKYLLIRPLDEGIDKEQLGFQMAREQKLAYEKLEKAEKKLKTLLDYKDKFVSIVSHDLRSPVAAVLGITNLLVSDEKEISKLDSFYQDMVFNIKDEMVRLLDYNDKLYHWSNLELGNFEIVIEKISLRSIINTAQRTSQSKFDSKEISFSTNLKKDIEIEVDHALFMQVLNNLVSNAVKFTPEKGEIAIIFYEKNENLEIVVSDSGVGMTKSVSENIFSGFTRNSTMGTSGEKGTGLGLGIVKKIIDAHGFTIRVESIVGKGSQFIITIPKSL